MRNDQLLQILEHAQGEIASRDDAIQALSSRIDSLELRMMEYGLAGSEANEGSGAEGHSGGDGRFSAEGHFGAEGSESLAE